MSNLGLRWCSGQTTRLEVPSLIPSKVHLNVDSNPVLMWKEYSQRSAESRGFSPGTPVSFHRES